MQDRRPGYNGGDDTDLSQRTPSRQHTETPTVQELEARIEQSAIEDQAKIDLELEAMVREGLDPNDLMEEDSSFTDELFSADEGDGFTDYREYSAGIAGNEPT